MCCLENIIYRNYTCCSLVTLFFLGGGDGKGGGRGVRKWVTELFSLASFSLAPCLFIFSRQSLIVGIESSMCFFGSVRHKKDSCRKTFAPSNNLWKMIQSWAKHSHTIHSECPTLPLLLSSSFYCWAHRMVQDILSVSRGHMSWLCSLTASCTLPVFLLVVQCELARRPWCSASSDHNK